MTRSVQTQPTCGLYTLKVHAQFCSAHALRDYPGDCRRLHGHNWKVETEVQARVLNDIGIAIDFKAIKAATRQLADSLDHRFLNDIEPFDRINPTAENLAAWFFRQLSAALNSTHVKVNAVTLWETDTACVRYTEVAA
ncbi:MULTISPECIES: 6-carboxytetrahydropterin synthase QueD [Methylomicrobium]|uniref:6-carboxy-5,6,7,8-tetrahydropterin synthase n=1 Tax=Methylomicrobium album BG8 TaxID=686340 RepID=H8GK10_METAL|nr:MULTISPECIES: 6-carboxytetrahydropterin synthase QueD [Methylomicrobium]EIC27969.1 queuosine biosynthesis protein QueD [Methylomicrobium album BG8]